MKKILFLDDCPNRHRHLVPLLGPVDLTYVATSQDAIKALSSSTFDIISLDHDLNDSVPGASEGNGRNVCEWMAGNMSSGTKTNTPVIIHSCNIHGTLDMHKVLLTGNFQIILISPYIPHVTAAIFNFLNK
jgi:CheY-like chemotaxis protein